MPLLQLARTLAWTLIPLGLAACGTPAVHHETAQPTARASAPPDFAVDARFALRQEMPEAPPRSLAGRLQWTHVRGTDQLLLSDPLSRGMAELRQDAAGARLVLADGREYSAPEAETLLRQTLGFALPLTKLAGWMSAARATRLDPRGRAEQLIDGDWAIDYAYDNDDATIHPGRVTLRYLGNGELAGLELRLRIEEWSVPK